VKPSTAALPGHAACDMELDSHSEPAAAAAAGREAAGPEAQHVQQAAQPTGVQQQVQYKPGQKLPRQDTQQRGAQQQQEQQDQERPQASAAAVPSADGAANGVSTAAAAAGLTRSRSMPSTPAAAWLAKAGPGTLPDAAAAAVATNSSMERSSSRAGVRSTSASGSSGKPPTAAAAGKMPVRQHVVQVGRSRSATGPTSVSVGELAAMQQAAEQGMGYGDWVGRSAESYVAEAPLHALLRVLKQQLPARQQPVASRAPAATAAAGPAAAAAARAAAARSAAAAARSAGAPPAGGSSSLLTEAEREQLLQLLPACDRAALQGTGVHSLHRPAEHSSDPAGPQAAAAAAAGDSLDPVAPLASVFSGAVFRGAVQHYQQLLAAGLLEDGSNTAWLKGLSAGSKGEGVVGPAMQLTRAQRAEARAAAKAGGSEGRSRSNAASSSGGGGTEQVLGRAGGRRGSGGVPPPPPPAAGCTAGGTAGVGGAAAVGSSGLEGPAGCSRPVLGVLGYLQRTSGAQVVSGVLDRDFTVPDALLGLAGRSD
jgi:hypothetical protein